ncbi:MAG: hypothetical protein HC822_06045 [Oscillochloris sp.]|nr:hypothetical protein [Oscillochloris sp.]
MQLSKLVSLTLLLVLFCIVSFVFVPTHSAHAAERTIPVGSSIEDAVNAAKPGDTLILAAGTYRESITIERSGAGQAPITLKGAGAGNTTIVGTIRIESAFIALQDLTVDADGSSNDAVKLVAPAADITLRGVHLHNGSGYGVRVGNDVARVLIEGCTINNFDAGSRDAHGVGIMTASDVTVRECDIFDTSGDAIQTNTPDYPGYERFAERIRIERNRLHDTRENAIDIKSTHDLVAHGNLIWGFKAVDSSDGMAIQVQHDARNITLSGNQIWSAVEGIEISRGSKNGTAYPLAPQDVLIAGNLIYDLVNDPNGDSGSGSGIVVRSSANVQLFNNTITAVPSSAIHVAVSQRDDYPEQLAIRNNLLDGGKSDLMFSFAPDRAPDLVVDSNHYVSGRVNGGNLDQWRKAGYDRNPTSGDPKLDPERRPTAESTLVDSGVDVGLPFKGAAPDRGWGEMEIVSAQPSQPSLPALINRLYLPLLAH